MTVIKENKRVRLIKAYREIFSSDSGKEVLNDLCKACNIYTSTMDVTPHEMVYKEGARSVVLRILKTVEIDPFELQRSISKVETEYN